jgi:hypothetical protein
VPLLTGGRYSSCLLYPQKRTRAVQPGMSALGQKRTSEASRRATLSRISDEHSRARQSDDDFGELAGLRVDVD